MNRSQIRYRRVRAGEESTGDVLARQAAINLRVEALKNLIESTVVWTTPETLEEVAKLPLIAPETALRLRAQATQLRILMAMKSAERIETEQNFGKRWIMFYQNWNIVKTRIANEEGSNEQQSQAMTSYSSQITDWESAYRLLISQPTSPNYIVVTERPKTFFDEPSVKSKGKFTALWILGLVGLFGLVRLSHSDKR